MITKTENDLEPLQPIKKPYLLVTHIDCYRDHNGRRYIDELWHKDLKEHLKYLKDFTLASPCRHNTLPSNTIALDNTPLFSNMKFIDLPYAKHYAESLLFLPLTIFRLWKAIAKTDIVHTGIAGWPFPYGWLITPIAKLYKKYYIIVVESTPWRIQLGMKSTIKTRIKSLIFETLARWCVNNADLVIFTQEEYQKSLLKNRQERGHVIHASWIDDEDIISDVDAAKMWDKKLSSSANALKVLFAGRLEIQKGIKVLLDAVRILDKKGILAELDIIGQGELLNECKKASENMQKSVKIQILSPLAYGREFMQLLREYHALVSPNLSDEQPRIVYDAYSQALPVLANNTAGLRSCVQNGKTGLIADSNSSSSLAKLLEYAAQNLSQLEKMGKAALWVARSMTHQEMHRKRWKLLLEMTAENGRLNTNDEKDTKSIFFKN